MEPLTRSQARRKAGGRRAEGVSCRAPRARYIHSWGGSLFGHFPAASLSRFRVFQLANGSALGSFFLSYNGSDGMWSRLLTSFQLRGDPAHRALPRQAKRKTWGRARPDTSGARCGTVQARGGSEAGLPVQTRVRTHRPAPAAAQGRAGPVGASDSNQFHVSRDASTIYMKRHMRYGKLKFCWARSEKQE